MSTPKRVKEQRQREMKAAAAKRKYEKQLAQKSVSFSKSNAQKSVLEQFKEFQWPDIVRRDEGVEYQSLNSNEYNTYKAEDKVYTGSLVKGVMESHKSNLLPVVDDEHIIAVTRMRR